MEFAPVFFGGRGDATLENQEAILAQLEAIEAKTGVTVLPLAGRTTQRIVNNEIAVFVSELAVLRVNCFDQLGAPVVLTGKTLRLAIETKHKDSVEELTPTIAGDDNTAFVFQVTEDMSAKEQVLEWSLWDVTVPTSKTFLMGGKMPVDYRPI
jgi:hypothetical protein